VITRGDVEAAAGSATEVEPVETPARSGQRETREPIKGVRKMMAQAMSQSAFTSPHVTEWITVDVTRTMASRGLRISGSGTVSTRTSCVPW